MKGMMDGWHGDEYDVELTWEELDDIRCNEADLQNDEDWINNRINSSQHHSNPPNCSDIGVYSDVGVEHE
jgi:hypothetical protein